MSTVCRDCAQPIEWMKTRAGKLMKVDPEPHSFSELEPGDKALGELGDFVVKRKEDDRFGDSRQRFFISHFETCPYRDYRKGPIHQQRRAGYR